MKKILLLSNMYPSKKYPHYGVFVKNSVELLQNGGYKVCVCAIPKCDNKLIRLVAYIGVYTKCIVLGILGKYDCIYTHFVSHTAIPARILKMLHPNLCLVENAHGNDVAIQTASDVKNIERSKKILPMAQWVIVPSEYFKELVARNFQYPKENIFVSPSGGVNSKILYPEDVEKAREIVGLSKTDYYIGFVGRIIEGKGWKTFLQAIKIIHEMNAIPKMKILIVGSGEQDKLLDQEIKKLQLKDIVVRRSFCNQSMLRNYYNSMNLFVFPSESESLGLVGLEAMACGKICICSDNHGVSTYAVDGENSFLFKRGDAEQLAQKIIYTSRILEDDKKRIICNALNTAAKYEREKISRDFISFFDKVLMRNTEEHNYEKGRDTNPI